MRVKMPPKGELQVHVYTDGAISKGKLGWGYIVLIVEQTVSGMVLKENKVKQSCGRVRGSEEYLAQRNVAAEMHAVKRAFSWLWRNRVWQATCKKVVLVHDYYGLKAWPTDEWQANNKHTRSYRKKMKEYMSQFPIEFKHVRGHSGVHWNERADELAKEGAKGVKAS